MFELLTLLPVVAAKDDSEVGTFGYLGMGAVVAGFFLVSLGMMLASSYAAAPATASWSSSAKLARAPRRCAFTAARRL